MDNASALPALRFLAVFEWTPIGAQSKNAITAVARVAPVPQMPRVFASRSLPAARSNHARLKSNTENVPTMNATSMVIKMSLQVV